MSFTENDAFPEGIPTGKRFIQKIGFAKAIGDSKGFKFDVNDISKMREDFQTLIERLHGIYQKGLKEKKASAVGMKKEGVKSDASYELSTEGHCDDDEDTLKTLAAARSEQAYEQCTMASSRDNNSIGTSPEETGLPGSEIFKSSIFEIGNSEVVSENPDMLNPTSENNEDKEVSHLAHRINCVLLPGASQTKVSTSSIFPPKYVKALTENEETSPADRQTGNNGIAKASGALMGTEIENHLFVSTKERRL
jgi:hypothetical protein